jgi:outer membrane protein assembly factor BamB
MLPIARRSAIKNLQLTTQSIRRNFMKKLTIFGAVSGIAGALWLGSITTASAAAAADQNWPQWRGPLATGVAPEANPPTTWSESSNVKWKMKLPGEGSSSPIVWGKMVFIEAAIPTGKKVEAAPAKEDAPPPADGQSPRRRGGMGGEKPTEVYQFALVCVDRDSGKILWQKIAREEVPHEGFRPGEGSFASASPLTDGKRVYAFFGSEGLYCYDMDGNLKWSKDLGKMQVKMAFGEGSSPALFGDTLVVNWDHEGGSFIIALNKDTGDQVWKEAREEGTSWATPLIVKYDGKAQVITDASKKIRGYDLKSGKVIWECGGLTANVIPSPVADDGTVYCMSGFRGSALMAIRLGRTGDLTGTDAIAWRHDKGTPYVPSPLLYGDKLYFFSGNNGMLSCLNTKSGEVLMDAERLEDVKNVYASPVGADGRVYLAGRSGTTLVLKNSGKVDILATNKLEDGFDASPAIAGKELFLRGHNYLYCIAEK